MTLLVVFPPPTFLVAFISSVSNAQFMDFYLFIVSNVELEFLLLSMGLLVMNAFVQPWASTAVGRCRIKATFVFFLAVIASKQSADRLDLLVNQ